jgi:hypothetical protein
MKKIIISFAFIVFAILASNGQTLRAFAYSTNGTVNNDIATTPGMNFFLSVDAYSTGSGSTGSAYCRAYLTKWYQNRIITESDIDVTSTSGLLKVKTVWYNDNSCGNVAHAYMTAQVNNLQAGVTGWANGGVSW